METNPTEAKINIERKKLILSLIKFLNGDKTTDLFDDNEKDSLDIAIQCLEDVYKIDADVKKYLEDEIISLKDLFHVDDTLSEETQSLAEQFKTRGNIEMNEENYRNAIEEYSKALQLNPKNPIYYCNRAAAYNKAEQPLNAIIDCKNAIKLDPKYSKAFGRMGKAYSTIGLTSEAHEAFLNALKYDPSNEMYQENLRYLNVDQEQQQQGCQSQNDLGSSALFSNSALFKMILQLMENDSFREMLEKLTSNENDSPYINSLLQMGQVLVNRLQAPEIFQQIQSGKTVDELSNVEKEKPEGS